MFSIIIPVYNAEKHLDKCLRSVVGQTYKDIEIIVINDGSTDNSAQIIERYGKLDSRIKVITQKNSGPSAARNSGLRSAAKEYILFIDSDDFIAENTCERLAEYVERDKSDVYVFGLYYDYGNKKSTGRQNLRYKKYGGGKDYMKTALEEGNFRTFAHSKLFKNELLLCNNDRIDFVDGLLGQDMLFVVQILCKANSVSVVPEYLYHYAQHRSGRISTQYREKDLDVLKFIDILYNDYYKTGEISKHIYAILTFRWASSCFIYKYVRKYFFNRQARKMINIIMKNKGFIEAVKLCAEESGIPGRDRFLAKILNISPFFYKVTAYFLTAAKGIFK